MTDKRKETVWHTGRERQITIVKCDCGEEVWCYNFTQTCECDADYNFNGDRLAPRSQWGEETGEHWSDCY